MVLVFVPADMDAVVIYESWLIESAMNKDISIHIDIIYIYRADRTNR